MISAARTAPRSRLDLLRARRAIAALYLRRIRRGALVVLVIVAGLSALVAGQFHTMVAGALDGQSLAALAENPAIRVLFGVPVALDDPGGFTVWRTGTLFSVLVGVWACVTATHLLRGEEEFGRSDLFLAGQLTRTDLVALSLAVLAGVFVVIGTVLAVTLVFSGTAVTGSVLHAAGLTGSGIGFASVGVLCAQIIPTRVNATGLSVGVLTALLMARMIADGAAWLDWLRWVTPFGVVGELAPYAHNRTAPLIVLFLIPVLLAVSAIVLAHHRDTGAGLLRWSIRRSPRLMLLGSLSGFAIRRVLPSMTGWAVSLAAFAGLTGLLAVSINDFFEGSARFTELAAAAGFGLLEATTGFAATMFSLLAIPAGCFAATRIAAMRRDERTGRAVYLFASTTPRQRLVAVELAVTLAGVLVLLAVVGLAMWVGTRIAQAPLEFDEALAGALNMVPIALLCIGSATAALGWLPSAVLLVGCLPAIGGFLLDVVAQSTGAPAWVRDLSPFAHLAAVPHSPPSWTGFAVSSAIALLFAIIGIVGYARRDLGA